MGYSNASKAVSSHVEPEDKQFTMVSWADSQNGNVPINQTKTALINESGLYALIFGSKLKSAKRFKRWIMNEILSSERKNHIMAPVIQNTGVQIFSNEALGVKMRLILNDDGSISVNAEDTAIGFGWTQEKNGKIYVKWERLNSFCKEMGFSPLVGKDDYIPESLFYRLGMKANNAVANKFQNWLAIDVIPSIRKTDGYSLKKKPIDSYMIEDPIERAKKWIKEEEERKRLELEVQEKEAEITEMKPKAAFHDAVTDSQNTISFGNFAATFNRNGLHLSRTQLFKYCRYKGYLCDAPDVHNKPTQEMINKGYMMSDKYVKYFKHKRPETSHTPKLTGKGQVWLTNRILNDYKQNPEHFMNMCNY